MDAALVLGLTNSCRPRPTRRDCESDGSDSSIVSEERVPIGKRESDNELRQSFFPRNPFWASFLIGEL